MKLFDKYLARIKDIGSLIADLFIKSPPPKVEPYIDKDALKEMVDRITHALSSFGIVEDKEPVYLAKKDFSIKFTLNPDLEHPDEVAQLLETALGNKVEARVADGAKSLSISNTQSNLQELLDTIHDAKPEISAIHSVHTGYLDVKTRNIYDVLQQKTPHSRTNSIGVLGDRNPESDQNKEIIDVAEIVKGVRVVLAQHDLPEGCEDKPELLNTKAIKGGAVAVLEAQRKRGSVQDKTLH